MQKAEDQEENLRVKNEKSFSYLQHFLIVLETQLEMDKPQGNEKLDKKNVVKLVEKLIVETQDNKEKKFLEYDTNNKVLQEKLEELKKEQKKQLKNLNKSKKKLEHRTSKVNKKKIIPLNNILLIH